MGLVEHRPAFAIVPNLCSGGDQPRADLIYVRKVGGSSGALRQGYRSGNLVEDDCDLPGRHFHPERLGTQS
jgi:hypothetical protein